jgi:hypothetical protein
MLFGREFEVEANDLSLQIASLAITMEPDGSAALIARVRAVSPAEAVTAGDTGAGRATGGEASGRAGRDRAISLVRASSPTA